MTRRFATPIVGALAVLLMTQSPLAAQDVHVVKMVDKSTTEFAFEPANLTVKPGDIIRWEQTVITPHNVEFREGPLAGTMSEFMVTPGQTYEVTIPTSYTSGTFKYICTPHEFMGMVGTITVAGSPPASTP